MKIRGNISHISTIGSLPSGDAIITVSIVWKSAQGAVTYDVKFRGSYAEEVANSFQVGDFVDAMIDDSHQRRTKNASRTGVQSSIQAYGQHLEKL